MTDATDQDGWRTVGPVEFHGDQFDVHLRLRGACVRFEPQAWRHFLTHVREGRFDRVDRHSEVA